MAKSYLGKKVTFLGRTLMVTSEWTIFGGGQMILCHYADDRGEIHTVEFSLYNFEQLFSGALT